MYISFAFINSFDLEEEHMEDYLCALLYSAGVIPYVFLKIL